MKQEYFLNQSSEINYLEKKHKLGLLKAYKLCVQLCIVEGHVDGSLSGFNQYFCPGILCFWTFLIGFS